MDSRVELSGLGRFHFLDCGKSWVSALHLMDTLRIKFCVIIEKKCRETHSMQKHVHMHMYTWVRLRKRFWAKIIKIPSAADPKSQSKKKTALSRIFEKSKFVFRLIISLIYQNSHSKASCMGKICTSSNYAALSLHLFCYLSGIN